MNKKFFAALASATMAFTASGSIAVFADDFVEEKTPVVDNGDVTPLPETVKWNKENFGDLVTVVKQKDTFKGLDVTLKENEEVKTADLAKVKEINLQQYFEGEVKGLEYFTELTKFDDSLVNNEKNVTNATLDFSANTSLTEIKVTKAADLTEIVLPEAFVNEDKTEEYKLGKLTVTGTALTSLDLTAQDTLKEITATGNSNLQEVSVQHGTKREPRVYTTLDLSNNNLETVDLANTKFTTLTLSNNHIGALDLSNTTATTATLGEQTFYVSETLENVNLAETFENFDKKAVAKSDKYDQETGVLTLETTGTTTYEYDTLLGATNKTLSVKLTAANPMNRLYNPNSGEHFYTADLEEKAALVNLGWNDEGYGWVAPKEGTGTKVYRLYNPNAGDHHYTTVEEEKNTLVAYGWKDENVGWYSDGGVTVYRQYNPYANGAGSHNYTTDKAENNYLVSLGWIYEGTAWTALQ